jgi:hypothetical protein
VDYLDEGQRVERFEDGQPVVWAMVRFVQGRGEVTFPVQLLDAVRKAMREKPDKADRARAVLDAIAQFLPATVIDDEGLPGFVIQGPKPSTRSMSPAPAATSTSLQSPTSSPGPGARPIPAPPPHSHSQPQSLAGSQRSAEAASLIKSHAAGPSFTLVRGANALEAHDQDPLQNQILEPLGYNPQHFGRAVSSATVKPVSPQTEGSKAVATTKEPARAPPPSRADLAVLQAKYDRLFGSEPPLIYDAYEVKRQMNLLEQKLLALGL